MACRCGEKLASLSTSAWRGISCSLRAGTMVSRSCVWGCRGPQGGGGLFGSRHPSDNWKVPVLAWPSVPLRLAPIRLLLTTEGPAIVCSMRARSLAGRAGRVSSCFCLFPSHFWLLCGGRVARCMKSLLHGHRVRLFCGAAMGRKGGCVQCFLSLSTVCLLN